MQSEVKRVFGYLNEPHRTMIGLMYGVGLRLNECLELRILLLEFVLPRLKLALDKAQQFHEIDQANSITHVHLPDVLAKNYLNTGKQLKWQYLFASHKVSVDPLTGNTGRHHFHSKSVSRAISNAVKNGKHYEACNCSYFSTLFCNPSFRKWP